MAATRQQVLESLRTIALAPAKLAPPAPLARSIARPRLRATLHEAHARALTLVIAPAGYAKTSAVAALARELDEPVAWVHLDERDRDPARFVTALLAAVALASPNLASASWPEPGPIDPEAWLARRLLIPLATSGERLTLVLDAAEAVEAGPSWDAIAWLLDNRDPGLRLCVIGREAPPLPLARLESEGAVARIGPEQLSFDRAQIDAALRSVIDRAPTPAELDAIEARSLGWPVAVRLLALELRDAGARAGPALDPRALAYVIDEVVERLAPEPRLRLLQTAILDELEPAIVAAVCGEDHVDEALAWAGLDAGLVWRTPTGARQHPLLREALLARIEREPGLERATLHARAARAYFARGHGEADFERGLSHAIAARDVELAAREVGERVWPVLRSGQFARLHQLLAAVDAAGDADALEPELRARLALARAWSTLARAPHELGPAIAAAAERIEALGEPESILRGSLAALRGLVELRMGDAARGRAIVDDALARLDAGSPLSRPRGLRVVLGLASALAAELAHDWVGAREQLARASGEAVIDPPLASAPILAAHRVRIARRLGALSEARDLAAGARALIEAQGWSERPAAGQLELEAAMVELYAGELHAAERLATRGLERVELDGDPSLLIRGLVALARIRKAAGDPDGARDALERAQARALARGYPWLVILVELERDPGAVDPAQLARLGPLAALMQTERVLSRALAWLDGDRSQAERDAIVDALEREREAAADQGRVLDRIEACTILAAILAETAPSQALLDEARDAIGDEPIHLPALRVRNHMSGQPTPAAAPEEPILSEREIEVLAAIARGLPNRLIARELHISLATVKTHVHHILAKLEVDNRTAAVHHARERGLLS